MEDAKLPKEIKQEPKEFKLPVKPAHLPHAPEPATVTLKETTIWQGVCAVLIVLLAVSIWTGGFGLRETPTGGTVANQPEEQQQNPENQLPERVQVSADDDPFFGSKDAPVTIIEFSDFQCPYCSRAAGIIESLEEKYISTGKVKVVFRDFPLSFHPNAEVAAEAAECANEQGKFREMHDKIFENQSAWSGETDPTAVFKTYAADLKLDTAKWETCYNSSKFKDEIQKDVSDGMTAGVSGTPTFFIGNDKDGYLKVIGAQPVEVFEQVIEAELA